MSESIKQSLDCTHTITIEFKTDLKLLNHPAIARLMEDMKAQIDSLADGSYDDEKDYSTAGIDTNYVLGHCHSYSSDRTQYFDEKLRDRLAEELSERYSMGGMDDSEIDDMSDSEMADVYASMVDEDDEMLVEANAQIAAHKMLTE